MFFGAGNLVFPLLVGRAAGEHALFSLIGLALSAVLFPLLGLFAMTAAGGKIDRLFAPLGAKGSWGLLFLIQLAMGPFGCMPRLFILMKGSLELHLPPLEPVSYGIGMAFLVFFLTVGKSRVIDLLGKGLTPVLLATLAILIAKGLFFTDLPSLSPSSETASHHFWEGLKGGYLTMDLISAILFATLLTTHLRGPTLFKNMTQASLIASSCLMLVYVGLLILAAHYAPLLPADVPPEKMLLEIALILLGPVGGILATVSIFLACLTTLISLADLFADYLKGFRIARSLALLGSLLASALFSSLGFQGILHLLAPILEIVYPILIALSIGSLWKFLCRLRTSSSC
jgi:LIVCS family branched-chain amino acid:cation transporter